MKSPEEEKGNAGKAHDPSGRDRMIWNVLSSWCGHMVFVVAGFIMPRMIDRHVGQASLGIWDFSWSLVSYFGMASLGVGSSVNRFVAKLRTEGDKEGLDGAVSSVLAVQVVVAFVVALFTVSAVFLLPRFFPDLPGPELSDMRWVVGILGASWVLQQLFDTFRGVMTGCHRWDLHNAINAISHGITVAIMLLLLRMGGGLRSLAAAYLCMTALADAYRYLVVRRICPELDIRFGKATWRQGREMLSFGVKTIVIGLPTLIIVQGNALLIARHLGPALLAVFSRPVGLLRNGQTFINKYANVLTPTAGSLQGAGRHGEIRELLLKTTRYSVALALPLVLFVSILGDPIMHVWMGPRYEAGRVMAILGAGNFLPMTQMSVVTILVGLNMHGRIGVANIVLSLALMGIGVGVLGAAGWTLTGAALLAATVLTATGAAVFLYACRKFDLSAVTYVRQSFLGPMAAGVPHAVALGAVRFGFRDRPVVALIAGCAASALVLGPIYWKYFLPQEVRTGFHRIPGFSVLARAMRIG